jgi:hypothetical protein
MDDDASKALVDPAHPIWKIMLLCVLVLGGGTLVGADVVSIAGL